MIQELIYTSAPQGLRAGASGYCTVAMTHGMSPALVDQLDPSEHGTQRIVPVPTDENDSASLDRAIVRLKTLGVVDVHDLDVDELVSLIT